MERISRRWVVEVEESINNSKGKDLNSHLENTLKGEPKIGICECSRQIEKIARSRTEGLERNLEKIIRISRKH